MAWRAVEEYGSQDGLAVVEVDGPEGPLREPGQPPVQPDGGRAVLVPTHLKIGSNLQYNYQLTYFNSLSIAHAHPTFK